MLMNVDETGRQIGRPMRPLLIQHDPHIYFLTHQSSRKVMQLAARPQVGLSIITFHCFCDCGGFRSGPARSPTARDLSLRPA
jgi:hypothetical protein